AGRWLARAWAERVNALHEADSAEPPGAISFLAAWAFAAVAPPALLVLIIWLLYGSILTRFYLAIEIEGAPGHSKKTTWDNAVDRLLNPVVRDGDASKNILLGRNYYLDYPVLLDRRILDEHGHITGGSGGGKTSLGVAPLLSQLIASEDCSVVLLALQGDPALFPAPRSEARGAGATLQWCTNPRRGAACV